MKVVGIYLAAGKSSRMGENKLLLTFRGLPLGSIALKNALDSSLDDVLVITNVNDPLAWVDSTIFSKSYQERWTTIPSKDSDKGQSYSIKTGLKEAIKMNADAVIILLADQPFVTSQMIDFLINAYGYEKSIEILGYRNEQVVYPPILFSKKMFPKLMELHGDIGAKKIIANFDKKILYDTEIEKVRDVDTPEDYEAIKKFE
ncbi:nucleotidyltransferase family protein [Bacillus sp. HNG]|uniref:nucleotidyltransferase family protein n=1 Tax=Bacillus sp. HNG TaxID=2293325 RepID=UPI000E2F1DB0|nr:nucleotidyltransferase family protein [Bacillus sp. HNG]RFB13384.1 nucleotidyltransferase family protein [Bacillus sp. HNG]